MLKKRYTSPQTLTPTLKRKMMNKGNKTAAIVAVLCVSLVHAGAYVGLTSVGSSSQMMMQEGEAASLTMHQFQLEGVVDQVEGNADDSAVESEDIPEPEVETPQEELPPEPDEPTPEPPKEEPKPEEPKPEEPKPEPPKEAVITTQAPSEQKVQQQTPKVAAPKPQERRPTPPKPQQKPADTARAVQTAKAVYSESEVSVLSKPVPGYPRAARQRRMQGTVDLLVGINASGAAQTVKISRSSGHDILDKAAAKAAQGIRLKPYKVNGVATPIQVKIQYVFKM